MRPSIEGWAIGLLVFMHFGGTSAQEALPKGLVYLRAIDPTIQQDVRYAGTHNFVGRPIKGYRAAECLLVKDAAEALKSVQDKLTAMRLSLVVWDCYRPARAVQDFLQWSTDPSETRMKQEFFPRTGKDRLFALGYIAKHSRHSYATAVDLGITSSASKALPIFDPTQPLVPCTEPQGIRFEDGTIDFGTGYDCLDVLAGAHAKGLSKAAYDNRTLLRDLMQSAGFKPYEKEWWHFEFQAASPPGEFDFEIRPIIGR
jgi:D-alanyl-D-alanine dipeptidase